LGQAVPQGRLGPAEPGRSFEIGQPFEVAEDDRQAVDLGQAGHLGPDRRGQIGVSGGSGAVRLVERRPLDLAPSASGPARLDGRAVGDPVQPGRQARPASDRPGSAGQRQERGLERILGILLVPRNRPRRGQDHRSMPSHQRRERRLGAPVGGESGQQLLVIRPRCRPSLEQRAKWVQTRAADGSGHW